MNKLFAAIFPIVLLLTLAGCGDNNVPSGVIYSCDRYTLYADSVVESNGAVAYARSSMHIVSSYSEPEHPASDNELAFNFLVNGNLREFSDSTKRHRVRLTGTTADDSLVFRLGEITSDDNIRWVSTDSGTIADNTCFTFRVDMRPLLRQMQREGFYVIRQGDTLRRKDFHGVWLSCSNGAECQDNRFMPERRLTDRGDSIYEITVNINPVAQRRESPREWNTDFIPLDYPRATLGMKLPDALYNMGVSNICTDTLSAVSPYAIILSLAYLDPERSKRALMAQIKNGRIISSNNSSWPIDVSRVAWILAAWEVYKVTGDESWAREVYECATLTLHDDNHVNYDSGFELYCGSLVPLSSAGEFYPGWMNTVDIYRSMSLTANVMYSEAYNILAQLGELVGDNVTRYRDISADLTRAINLHFWIPDRGYYSQYLYGAFPVQSALTDNLGQALSCIYGVAKPEMTERLFDKTPTAPYGIPAVWPSPADRTDRYSNCTRADVQAFWNIAAARSLRMEALAAGLASQFRAAAIFAGESPYVGSFSGVEIADSLTQSEIINSAAARLSMTFRIFAGMAFSPEGITFNPVVPAEYKEEKFISGFRYRNATLTIAIHGTGDRVARFMIDGVSHRDCLFPADLEGRHTVDITMAGGDSPGNKLVMADSAEIVAPTPRVMWCTDGTARIFDYNPALTYSSYLDGVFEEKLDSMAYSIFNPSAFAAVKISAALDRSPSGYTTPPHFHIPQGALTILNADELGNKPVAISATLNPHLAFEVEVSEGGAYLVDINYANGNGPILYQRNCGIRTLLVNGDRAGAIVMPQLGTDRWDLSAFSNMIEVRLERGLNTLAIDYLVPYNINADAGDNRVLINYIRIIKK